MSSSVRAPSSTQPIFDKAVAEYKKKTGKDLTTHPLAAEIRSCGSPEAILTVLEKNANELTQCRRSDERLIKWLNPTVNVLNALSATLGEGAGSVSYRNQAIFLLVCPKVDFQVFPPTKIVFSGLGILLVVSTLSQSSSSCVVIITPPLAGGKEHCNEPRCASRTLQQNRKILWTPQDIYRSPTGSGGD
jgi:hypothetical protein